MKIFTIHILILFLFLSGCDNKNKVVGPKEEGITYSKIKANYEKMIPSEFAKFIDSFGDVVWTGTISKVDRRNSIVQFQVRGASNLLILTSKNRNDPIINKARRKVGETVTFRASIRGVTNDGTFAITGYLIHIND